MAPREEVKMYVKYRLAGPGVIVANDPEASIRLSPLTCNTRSHMEDMADEGVVRGI